MNDVLFQLLQFALVVAIALITRYLIPWMQQNTNLAKNQFLSDLASMAVRYSEQILQAPGEGAERKRIVTTLLKKQLLKKNISITDEQLDALIEAAVYTMHNSDFILSSEQILGITEEASADTQSTIKEGKS